MTGQSRNKSLEKLLTDEMVEARINSLRETYNNPEVYELLKIVIRDNMLAPARIEVERLKGALKPFADLASAYDPPECDDNDTIWHSTLMPTIGQLRKARAALEAATTAQTEYQCPWCGGSGMRGRLSTAPCERCDGTGTMTKDRIESETVRDQLP